MYFVNFHVVLENIPARYFFLDATLMFTKFNLTLGNIMPVLLTYSYTGSA